MWRVENIYCNNTFLAATYDTSVKISDHHGNGVNGYPVLQFCIQLFGENGYTRKLPLEIEANQKANQKGSKKLEMDFKRKMLAADVGWVSNKCGRIIWLLSLETHAYWYMDNFNMSTDKTP